MKTKIIFLLCFLPVFLFGQEQEETALVKWEGSTSSLNLNPTILATNLPGGVSAAPISTGTTPSISNEVYEGFTFTNWLNSSNLVNSQYIQFQISATEGYQIELEKFIFWVKIDQGAEKYQVHYSKSSNFSGEQSVLLGEETATASPVKKELSFPSGYILLPNETLYIRIYGYKPVNPDWSEHRFTLGYQSNGPTITGTISYSSQELTANNDTFTAEPNQTTALDVLANDMEGNAPINSVTLNSSPSFGTVVWNNLTQKFDYTPNNDYFGPDSFTYTIGNGVDDYSTATVNIFVSGTTPTGSLSGIYLIDDQYGHFSTITSAVAYLNTHTVVDEVTFLLYDDIYTNSTGEVFPIEITAVAAHTVTFKPAPNKNVNIDAYNENGPGNWPPVRAVFKLNGADNITFNGSNDENDTKYLTVTNHCNILDGSDRTIFWLTGQSENITLQNMILMQGAYNADSSVSAAIFAGNNSTINLENGGASNNPVSALTVSKNLFMGVKQGVFINNSANNTSTDIIVYRNDFGTEAGVDKITHSVFLKGANGFNIYENIIYDLEIDFSADLDYSGIYVGGNSSNGIISKNQILGIHRTNSSQQVAGIHLASTYGNSNNPNNIAVVNNFIADVYSPGSHNDQSGGAYGIYLHGGHGYKLYHNSVNVSENVSDGVCAAIMLRGNANSYSGLDIRNNIFMNNQTNGNYETRIRKFAFAAEGNLAVGNNLTSMFDYLDNNNYYAPEEGGFVAGHDDLNTGTTFPVPDHFFVELADWQTFTASAEFETNSGSEETPFVSNFNLHISDSDAWVNNNGVGLTAEFAALGLPYDDIDGQLRSITKPDIGADEFGTPPVEPGICEITLYWNGTSWGDENGDPVIFDDEEITEPNRDFLTEIRGAYDTEIHGSFSTCELTIATGGSLRVAEDDYVFIVNRLINNLSVSAIIVENNGSIVQETDFNENIGEITYKRKAMPMYNFDYTYWGSPVTGQTTSALSPNSGGNMFAWNPEVYYDTTYEIYLQRRWGDENNSYVSYTGVMEPGHGYIIKAPNNFPSDVNVNPSIFTANFKGVPNSGPYNIATTGDPGNQLNGNPAQNPTSGYPHGDYAWNFFSNPYPSAIDIDKFRIANNQTLGDNVYLWSHNTKPVPGQTYYQYVANDFAVYNAKLGQSTCATPFPQGSITPNPNYNHPTRFIAAGQGFFMPAKTGTVQFNNSMRVSTINGTPNSIMPNDQFFKVQDSSNSSDQGGEEIHNIKLSIRNEQNAFHQMLLGYVADASDDLDDVDGILFGGNYVSLYSVIENYHLVVQGRGLPFTETDQVQLGFSLYISGDFSIHLDYFDGLFEEDSQDQDIYLYDSYLDITHDLKVAPYEFTSEEGTFNDRFVLKYMSPLSIGDINNLDNSWAVYQKDNQLQVAASGFDIKDIAVYDVLGRLVYQKENINTNSHTIEKMNSNQVLIVKVTSTDNTTSVKKVFN